MTDMLIHREINIFARDGYVAEGPIDFGTWLEYAQDLDTDLVNGVMVDRVAPQFPHEGLFAWLMTSFTRSRRRSSCDSRRMRPACSRTCSVFMLPTSAEKRPNMRFFK